MATLTRCKELDEVYRLYGVAAHHCYNIELSCAFLMRGTKWKQESALTAEKIVEIGRKLDGATLGSLIGMIKSSFELTGDNEQYLAAVLKQRNYLIHEFFGKRSGEMNSRDALPQIRDELRQAVTFLHEASEVLAKWSGITEFMSTDLTNRRQGNAGG
jgi:hypothetical protein